MPRAECPQCYRTGIVEEGKKAICKVCGVEMRVEECPKNLTLKLNMENAAFSDEFGGSPTGEVARILHKLADHIYSYDFFMVNGGGKLVDINGNTVGEWEIHGDLPDYEKAYNFIMRYIEEMKYVIPAELDRELKGAGL